MLPNVQRTDAADHVPVLADEVRELLDVQPGETVVDATFGAGGHSRLLVADLQGSGKLVAIDRDPSVRPYFDRVKGATRGGQTRFLRGDYGGVRVDGRVRFVLDHVRLEEHAPIADRHAKQVETAPDG